MELKTKGDVISRLRGTIKEVSDDSLYSNRYLWSVFYSAALELMKQQSDKGSIYSQVSVWSSACIEFEPVSSLYCNCTFLPYDCIVYRSKKKLPALLESADGPVYRFISTPDMSKEFTLTTPYLYKVKSGIKYNKEKYVFMHDGYLYMPDFKYPVLAMSALFTQDVSEFQCNPTTTGKCGTVLDAPHNLTNFLINAAIKISLQELGFSKQAQPDQLPNVNPSQVEQAP